MRRISFRRGSDASGRPRAVVQAPPRARQGARLSARALVVTAGLGVAGCAGSLASKPAVYAWHKEMVNVADTEIHVTVAKPSSPSARAVLIVFASGDGGLMGVSKAILQHLADLGHHVAGFSSREALGALRDASGKLDYTEARSALAAIAARARTALGLPDGVPVIVAGMSRGANMVIAAAGDPAFRSHVRGGVAIALTRELDYLSLPAGAKGVAGVERDQEGRVQAYPAIQRLGSTPLAIIQSTRDEYVPSAESRRLLGPDTPTRRLYEVDAKDHSFGGAEDALMRDLDDAIEWVLRSPDRQNP